MSWGKFTNKGFDGLSPQETLLAGLIFFGLLVAAIFVASDLYSSTRTASNANVLLLGENAPEGVFVVEPHPFIPLDQYTKDEILLLRAQQLQQYTDILEGEYSPFLPIFRRIEDKAPWFSVNGFYFYGFGENSTQGASQLSQQILTPLQLVVPNFWGLSVWTERNLRWNAELVTPEKLNDPSFPLRPEPGPLTWDSRHARAEISYAVSAFVEAATPYLQKPFVAENVDFGVSLFNARDLNLTHVYLSPNDSSGILAPKQKPIPLEITGHLSYVNRLCNKTGLCNHERNAPPPLDTINVTNLPAVAVFKFWTGEPQSVDEQSDFTYTIRIE